MTDHQPAPGVAVPLTKQRLIDAVTTLTADLKAMTAALDAVTHPFVPCADPPSDSCDHDYAGQRDGSPWLCMAVADDPVHVTPAVVRARAEAGAAC